MPQQFCYVDEVVPSNVRIDLKYCSSDNFVGRPIDGYTRGKRAILRKDAAQALAQAATLLRPMGYGIIVWDAYRPACALQDFYAWSQTDDVSTKETFYPNITKKGIYEHRYIGLTSEHTWGIAVDITLYHLDTGKEVDMGGRHDLLDPSSATDYMGISPIQQKKRRLLRDTMAKAGLRNYSKEWWHYFLTPKGKVRVYGFPLNDSLPPAPQQNAISS